jgi:hypothetical protein
MVIKKLFSLANQPLIHANISISPLNINCCGKNIVWRRGLPYLSILLIELRSLARHLFYYWKKSRIIHERLEILKGKTRHFSIII